MHLIDSHTHVQFAAFARDYKEVIKRAQEAGVGMINVGTQKDTSKRAVELAHEFENVWATVGLHPIHTEKSYHDPQEVGTFQHSQECKNDGVVSRDEGLAPTPEREANSSGRVAPTSRLVWGFNYEYYKKLATDPKVAAIGECGLDYFHLEKSEKGKGKSKQKEVFIKQIELAQELGKPLMIHCRPSKGTEDAYGDLLDILKAIGHKPKAKVAHFYAGSLEMAKKLLEKDFYFTFGGVITFSRSYDGIIKYLPLDRIMIETDAPYVAPEPYRGKRNEPAYVVEVAKKLAEIKGVSFEQIAEITTKNCQKVFAI